MFLYMEKHELVDVEGNKTGKVLTHEEIRDINNIPKGYYMSVVGVVILNEDNKILMKKRSRFKRSNPGKWGICGGKVDFGESTVEAGIRETSEEIGIQLDKDDLKLLSVNAGEKAVYTVYYAKKNISVGDCKIQEKELEEVKYFDIDEIADLDNEGVEWLDSLKELEQTT